MFRHLRQRWQRWQAKVRMTAPTRKLPRNMFYARDLVYPELREVYDKEDAPTLPPYRGLATLWDEHAPDIVPDYLGYLTFLAGERGDRLESVLDLACGTGRLTSHLAGSVPTVVGVDSSPDMLIEARRRYGERNGLSFAQGDFRDFDLGRRFDAAVCASNSLNYVHDRDDLRRVFDTVARHLRPGGVFVFDTVPEAGMWALSDLYLHAQVGNDRFAIHFEYDNRRQVETAWVVVAGGVEKHRRVPVGLADVRASAAETGLTVTDTFTNVLAPWHPGPSHTAYFVLTRGDDA